MNLMELGPYKLKLTKTFRVILIKFYQTMNFWLLIWIQALDCDQP